MRIAIVAPPWLPVPPPAYGGTEAVVDALARGLDAAGHDVLLIGHPDSTCPVRTGVGGACRGGRAHGPSRGRAGARHRRVRAGPRLRRGQRPHDRRARARCVASRPAGGGDEPQPVLAHARTRSTPRSSGADRSWPSPQSHARSTELPIAAVIHHGIDVDTFPVGSGAGGYLAMLTRMTPDKGIERAMRLARAAGVPLRIAAKIREQREHDYFESVIAPLLGTTVEFLGEVDAAGKRELLAGAVGLLNPIEWDEPFGMAMIESLACGTPVVGTPKGAAPEIVSSGTTGFLADDDAGLIDADRPARRDRPRRVPRAHPAIVLDRAHVRAVRRGVRTRDHVPRAAGRCGMSALGSERRQVIAVDVDGTLYDGESIHPDAIAALDAARSEGDTILIVSGRPWRDLPVIAPEIVALATAAVCEDGAVLVDIATGERRRFAEPPPLAVVDELQRARRNRRRGRRGRDRHARRVRRDRPRRGRRASGNAADRAQQELGRDRPDRLQQGHRARACARAPRRTRCPACSRSATPATTSRCSVRPTSRWPSRTQTEPWSMPGSNGRACRAARASPRSCGRTSPHGGNVSGPSPTPTRWPPARRRHGRRR